MKLSKYKKKHIFCIEGNWAHSLKDKTSIKSALEFLEHNIDVKTIHKNSSTLDQFQELLNTSMQRTYKQYGIIYLAFHGNPGLLNIGKRKKITLDEIAEMLNGRAVDKIIHFGSCSTLNINGWDLRRFWKQTGALAISGYKTDIDFVPSTILDIAFFDFCQKYRSIKSIETNFRKYYNPIAKKLGFKMIYEK